MQNQKESQIILFAKRIIKMRFLTSLNLLPFAEVETGMFLYDVVKSYMERLKVLSCESEGRIIDISLLNQ
jgi:hypothetical protein